MKKIIFLLPLLLIGCKEAPKEYYSAGEVEVIEPVKHTTNVSDSDTVSINNAPKNVSDDDISPEVREYLEELNRKHPLRHMMNPEEAAPHTVNIRIK